MYKVSELISMPVISIYESEIKGIVYNLIFDTRQKKCKYACILNENDGLNHTLNMSDIHAIGNECIFIKNNTSLELDCKHDINTNYYINPLNLHVYDLTGKQLGICINILLNDKYCISSLILNDGKTIDSKHIFNIGKSTILIDKNNTNIARFKPKQKVKINNLNENKVIMLSNFNNQIPDTTQQNTSTTNKIITDFRFLVGRILNKDIIAINGEMIAKNGSIITKEIVNKASFYGKLVEIARHSINKKISN